jgi:outer membrane protein assembly factor BamB
MTARVISALLLSFLMVASSGHMITINSPSPQPLGRFGSSIDSANGLLVVGAPYQLANSSASRVSGLVYIFNSKTGSLTRTLSSPHPYCAGLGGCAFGSSVRLAGRYLIVGAPGETVNGIELAGEVFVFNVHTGSLLNTLVSPSPEFEGSFGADIAQENGLVYVGASIESANGLHAAGHVYAFNINTGSLTATFVSPNLQKNGVFGIALAVSGGRLIVGSEEGPPSCYPTFCENSQGRAYVFNATSGSLISSLVPTYPSELFGNSVAISNQEAIVGADAETVNGIRASGRVYVFNATTGSLLRTMVDPEAHPEGRFGFPTVFAGDQLLIGAANAEAGIVYVFNLETGNLTTTIVSPSPSNLYAQFGFSIVATHGRVYIGSPGETVNGQYSAGAVYIFAGIHHDHHGHSDSNPHKR